MIHRYNNGAPQGAAQERNHPFRTVLAPDNDLIAFADLPRLEFPRELLRRLKNLSIGPACRAVPTLVNVGTLATETLEMFQIFEERIAFHQRRCYGISSIQRLP